MAGNAITPKACGILSFSNKNFLSSTFFPPADNPSDGDHHISIDKASYHSDDDEVQRIINIEEPLHLAGLSSFSVVELQNRIDHENAHQFQRINFTYKEV